MSLLAMLMSGATATTAGGTGGTTTTGGPSGTSTATGRPILTDSLAQSFRPELAAIYTLNVGPSREFTTLAAAIDRGKQLQSAAMSADGKQFGANDDPNNGKLRNYRVDIVVDPGDYPETAAQGVLSLPFHFAIYAADGKPGNGGTTVVHAGFDYAMGWCYCEGIQLVTPDGSAKYPVHQEMYGATVWSRMDFRPGSGLDAAGSGWPFGTDGANDGYVLCYDCDFRQGRTNNHGWAASQMPNPATFCYVKCRFPQGGLTWHAMDDTRADQLWIQQCAIGWGGYQGAATQYHAAGNTLDGTAAEAGWLTTPTDARTDWPQPTGGLTAAWRTKLGIA